MSNITKNRSKPFGILIGGLIVALVAIVATMSITGAWFTDSQTETMDGDAPEINVGLVKYVNSTETALTQEMLIFSYVNNVATNSLPNNVYVKVQANVDVYLRANVLIQFYDASSNIITGLNASTYYTVTYKSTNTLWSTSTPTGFESGYTYFGGSTPVTVDTATINSQRTLLIESIARTASDLPDNVKSVKLLVFAEAVQGNNTGLKKWKV